MSLPNSATIAGEQFRIVRSGRTCAIVTPEPMPEIDGQGCPPDARLRTLLIAEHLDDHEAQNALERLRAALEAREAWTL